MIGSVRVFLAQKSNVIGSVRIARKKNVIGSVQTMFFKKCVYDRFGSEKNVIGSDLLGFLV